MSEGSQRLGCQRSQLQTLRIPPYGSFRQYAKQWTTLLIPQSQSKTSLSVFTQMKGASKSNKSSNSTTPDQMYDQQKTSGQNKILQGIPLYPEIIAPDFWAGKTSRHVW